MHGEVGPTTMNQERYISSTRMIAVALWVTVSAMLVASWVLIFVGFEGVAYMLALSSGVLAPAAGVAHIKVYSMKVTNLIRVTSGLTGPSRASGPSEDTVLHRIH